MNVSSDNNNYGNSKAKRDGDLGTSNDSSTAKEKLDDEDSS